MTLRKKMLCVLLAMLMILLTALPAAAADEKQPISEVRFSIDPPLCGHVPGVPDVWPEEDNVQVGDEPCLWAMYINETDPWASVPYMGMFFGGETYTAVITFVPEEGCVFEETAQAFLLDSETWDYVPCEILECSPNRLTVVCRVTAEHDWDWDTEDYLEPTCVDAGHLTLTCLGDPAHVKTQVLEPVPERHEWGEWETVKEPTKTEEGEKRHSCAVCGETETAVIPRVTIPYTKVFEPETSWPMAATIAWRADGSALGTASAEVRPATAFVRLDRDLNVYDRDGGLLSGSIEDYVDATTGGMIPAFIIEDRETAEALKEWIPGSSARPGHAGLYGGHGSGT